MSCQLVVYCFFLKSRLWSGCLRVMPMVTYTTTTAQQVPALTHLSPRAALAYWACMYSRAGTHWEQPYTNSSAARHQSFSLALTRSRLISVNCCCYCGRPFDVVQHCTAPTINTANIIFTRYLTSRLNDIGWFSTYSKVTRLVQPS